jgi:hypothetical protein
MGKLTIDGTLDLAQFWPEGESDADTAKVVINVEPGAIRYRRPARARSRRPPTKARSSKSTAHRSLSLGTIS